MQTKDLKGMKDYSREQISEFILESLKKNKEACLAMYKASKEDIGYFFIDDLLPEELAHECFQEFPSKSEMRELKSIREYKYVSAQMNEHSNLLEEILYAFQAPEVVNAIGKICKIESLFPDDSLYAGGLSLMGKNNFLLPHLDNSHDAERERWRVLNLLYYVTPDWDKKNGGNLEVWPNGPKHYPIEIVSRFNRLVVMATHGNSWHSVNQVKVDNNRCCISNYYFSNQPLKNEDNFHVTTFRARPRQKLLNAVLKVDSEIRMWARKVFKKGVRKNPHIYKKDKS